MRSCAEQMDRIDCGAPALRLVLRYPHADDAFDVLNPGENESDEEDRLEICRYCPHHSCCRPIGFPRNDKEALK